MKKQLKKYLKKNMNNREKITQNLGKHMIKYTPWATF